MVTDLITKTGVKEELRPMDVSNDYYDELNEFVRMKLKESKRRAKSNGRKTVMENDV